LQDRENTGNQHNLVDDSKAAAVAGLGQALTAIGMKRKSFGEATIHASSAREALFRLGTLALRGDAHANASRIKEEVQRCLNIIVHIARVDGKRFVREISEVVGEV
jgi:hypothetical protein